MKYRPIVDTYEMFGYTCTMFCELCGAPASGVNDGVYTCVHCVVTDESVAKFDALTGYRRSTDKYWFSTEDVLAGYGH